MEFDFERFNLFMKNKFGVTLPNSMISPALDFSKPVAFSKGNIILGIGEPMEKVYFILNGIARSYYLDIDGNDITKIFLPEMSFCVGENFITNEKSIQGFEAIENISALEFSSEKIKMYILSVPELKELYIKALEKTIVYKMHRESSFQLKSATERYLDFKKEFPNIEKRVSQSCVASYLGITPVSLSRIRRTIKEEN